MVSKSGLYVPDEREAILEEARYYRDKSPEERVAIFRGIMRMVSATWAHLPQEEQLRRLRIGDSIDPRPDPWWKHVRREALP